jgi:O-antigen ligase
MSSLSGNSHQEIRISSATPRDLFWNLLDRPLNGFIGRSLIFICSFLNLANVMVDKDDVSLDVQVLLKLGVVGLSGLYGGWGAVSDARVRKVLVSFPVAWMVILVFFFFVAAPFSISPLASSVSAIAVCTAVLLTVTVLVQEGVFATMKSVFYGMSLFIVCSWLAYFLWPSVGIMAEPITDGQFTIRMAGIAHPNTLGQYSGITVVFGIILMCTFKRHSWFVLLTILLAVCALAGSMSRTSTMATACALLACYRHVFFKREYFYFYICGVFFGLLGILILATQVDLGAAIADKLTLVSKSGDAEELTSATGRSDIWAYAMHLLSYRPITGYGAATSKFYLHDYSMYTHNLILNVAFSTGYIGGLAAVCMVLGRIRSMFKVHHVLADGIIVFIVVNGFFENVIFSTISGMPTIVWVVALAWPLLTDDPAVKMGQEVREQADTTPRFLRLGGTQ